MAEQPTAPADTGASKGADASPRYLLGLVLRAGTRAATRRLRPSNAGPVSSTTAQDRGADLVALGSRLGVAEAAHRARRTFASAERKVELDEAHQLRTAADVTAAIGGMKGVLMKLAQMQSYLDDSLPPAWREALSGLQADAPPMAPELAASVVVAELAQRRSSCSRNGTSTRSRLPPSGRCTARSPVTIVPWR